MSGLRFGWFGRRETCVCSPRQDTWIHGGGIEPADISGLGERKLIREGCGLNKHWFTRLLGRNEIGKELASGVRARTR